SILYEPRSDVYLVSNINGDPTASDGNGFISRVAPDGRILELKWIDGAKPGVRLNGPKGMAVAGDTLYVSDITAVRMFDLRTGAPKDAVVILGSTFMNDLAAGREARCSSPRGAPRRCSSWNATARSRPWSATFRRRRISATTANGTVC